jgi:hypothetical protein
MLSEQSRRGTGKVTLVIGLVMALTGLPAGAAPEGHATGLHAVADPSDGRAVDINGHTVVYMAPGVGAEVTMPPQSDAVVRSRPGGSLHLLNNEIVTRNGWEEQIADGNLADGTAAASTTQEDLHLRIESLDVTITVESIRSVSRTDCAGESSAATASAGSAVAGLRINGEPIDVLSEPNGPGHIFTAPDDRGYVEIQTMQVEPHAESNGWTTTALLVRAGTLVPTVVTVPDEVPITHELAFGITATTVDCA